MPSPDELATQIFDAQEREAARNERRQLMELGLIHDLRLPISEMSAVPPSAEELAEKQADRAATQMRFKTENAKLGAKIQRWRRGKVTS